MISFTVGIIIVTCLVSFLALNNRKLMDALIFWPPAIQMQNQYYRFVTCGLIHADLMHLFFNMFTLYFFGSALETYYMGDLGLQHYYFLLLYGLALIVANIPSYFKHRDDYNYRSLGASGAVSAVLFAYILIKPWDSLYLFGALPVPAIIYVVLFVAYSVFMSRRGGDNVNHDAHLWGALFGVVFTIVAHPGVVSTFLTELSQPHLDF
jgi:membrane associated rhomboid family serine protease